jgi:hypothetical protein
VQVKDVLVVGVDLGINGILNINAMDNTPDDHISKKIQMTLPAWS